MSITLKTPAEVALIRKAGLIHAKILNEVGRMVKPGISTGELNAFAEKRCAEEKVLPAFKGYQGFPAALCTSVNNQVVHTIPSYKQILEEGDIVAIDFGVTFAGWHADACMTFAVGKISKEAQQLMDATKASLYLAIAQAKAGNTTGDIGNAIE
ncbi:MAG: M24 family metallopeptidase, partial [Candidatus Gracilibacteria bacterium]